MSWVAYYGSRTNLTHRFLYVYPDQEHLEPYNRQAEWRRFEEATVFDNPSEIGHGVGMTVEDAVRDEGQRRVTSFRSLLSREDVDELDTEAMLVLMDQCGIVGCPPMPSGAKPDLSGAIETVRAQADTPSCDVSYTFPLAWKSACDALESALIPEEEPCLTSSDD